MLMRKFLLAFALTACVTASAARLEKMDLNGSWAFAFKEGQALEEVANPAFVPTTVMAVPGCYDAMPDYLFKRGTGLYRRTFTLSEPVNNAWLVIEGMGLRGRFQIDGKDLGTHPYPYAPLELATGPLAAGTHTLFAAIDNQFDFAKVPLARVFYDFYFYGGFYRGVKLAFDNRRLFVRTRDYKTGTVEVEAVNFDLAGEVPVRIDGTATVQARFAKNRAVLRVPNFRLWSPETPNLHTLALADGLSARFGIRTIEARAKKLWLNGRELFLKGVNRHEQCKEFGVTTSESQMVRDLQLLKRLNANFIRGAHYQQNQRFLDLCDEMGMLVWEESLGWGNGQGYTRTKGINEFKDEAFCRQQVIQTRNMVRTSFNHPSVIIFAFLNEPASGTAECKKLVDELIATIRAEDSGRLITFACSTWRQDICNANTDLVSVNAYPGTIPAKPGTREELRQQVADCFNAAAKRFRNLYPDKPIIVSESGCAGYYGHHDAYAPFGSEEFQDEYLTDIMDVLWANPDFVGYTIWQFTDTNTHTRNCEASRSGRLFGISIAGIVDFQRRPKKSFETVRRYFGQK